MQIVNQESLGIFLLRSKKSIINLRHLILKICLTIGTGKFEAVKFATGVSELCRKIWNDRLREIEFIIIIQKDIIKLKLVFKNLYNETENSVIFEEDLKNLRNLLDKAYFEKNEAGINNFIIINSSKKPIPPRFNTVLKKLKSTFSEFSELSILDCLAFQDRELISRISEINNQKQTLEKVNSELKTKNIMLNNLMRELDYSNKEMIRTMVELERAYDQITKIVDQIAYSASHDLQEPLRMIVSFTQLIKQKYFKELGKEGKEFIDYSIEGALRMKYIIDNLLIYTKITGSLHKFEKCDCTKVLKNVLKNLSEKIENKNAQIVSSELPNIYADRSQIIFLFQELISNSLKFCQNSPKINIQVSQSNNSYIFSFKDNGIGISSNYFDQIFILFKRLNDRKEYKGAGMGLAICKNIIERHKGDIWVETDGLGAGTTFYFSIPKIEL